MSSDNPTPKPTIEQRLEAVTQSLELVASMQVDNDRRFNKRFSEILDGLERLAPIAENHEHRLTDLEDGEEQP